ncbi:hypothetical protein C0J52_17435 [Blattella germanica]|nr:hypothetical protein C0J52_17435 [Blattella germanica]
MGWISVFLVDGKSSCVHRFSMRNGSLVSSYISCDGMCFETPIAFMKNFTFTPSVFKLKSTNIIYNKTSPSQRVPKGTKNKSHLHSSDFGCATSVAFIDGLYTHPYRTSYMPSIASKNNVQYHSKYTWRCLQNCSIYRNPFCLICTNSSNKSLVTNAIYFTDLYMLQLLLEQHLVHCHLQKA